MKKIINFVALAILAGLAVVYFTLGPSVLLGGPSKSAIVAGAVALVLTRLVVVALVAAVAGLATPIMLLRGARQRAFCPRS